MDRSEYEYKIAEDRRKIELSEEGDTSLVAGNKPQSESHRITIQVTV